MTPTPNLDAPLRSSASSRTMAQMKTVSLIAANNEKLREQMQTALDGVVATLEAARIAIDLLDARVLAMRSELIQMQKQQQPQGEDVPDPNG